MSRLRKSFLPFSWNPVAIIFTQGTSASINLASYLKNDRNYPITYSLIGTLQSGVTHSNGIVTYNGAGGAATTTVQFRATSGTYVADSAATVSIVATQVNRAPVWDTPSGSVGTFAATGGTRSVQLSATDPDGDPVTYSRTGSAADTAPGSFTVTTNGLLTVPENVAASTYTVEVRASDGLGGQAARQFTATVQAATSASLAADFRFEGDWIDSTGNRTLSLQGASPTISSTFAREGTRSARCAVSNVVRSEVQISDYFRIWTTYWIGFSLRLGSSFSAASSSGMQFLNSHAYDLPDWTRGSNSILAIAAGGGTTTNSLDVWGTYIASPTGLSNQPKSQQYSSFFKNLGTCQSLRDQWLDFVFQVRFDWRTAAQGGIGFCNVWMNGVQQVAYVGPIGSFDTDTATPSSNTSLALGPYQKAGIYVWDANQTRDVYIDALRIAGADGSYSAVAPR